MALHAGEVEGGGDDALLLPAQLRQDVAALTRTTSNLETQLQQERSRIAPVAAPPQARPRERRDGPPAGDYIQYPDPQMKKLEIRQ